MVNSNSNVIGIRNRPGTGTPATLNYYKIPSALFPEVNYQIWNTGGSDVYTDYNFDTIPNAITGTTGYVDLEAITNGTGTEASPFNTMSSCNGSSYNIFYIKGKGRAGNSFVTWSKNAKMLAWPGFSPELTSQTATDLIWTQNGTQPTVYDATWPSASGFISNVCDRAVVDSDGAYTGYAAQTNLTNVAAAAGRFWYDSANNALRVRTIDGRVPDNNIVALMGTGNMIGATASVASNRYIYVEGIKTLGGAYGCFMGNAGAAILYVGLKDCEFSSAGGTEAATYMSGRTQGYFRNCKSYYNRDDAFDYNSSLSSIFLEWYCKSGKNSYTGAAINGSTSHVNSRVIRVKCEYNQTAGKCLQDINDTKSYNIRVIAGGARAAAPDDFSYASNSVASGLTEMYLIECRTTVAKGFRNFSNSTINLYDGTVGNLQTATNDTSAGTLNILTMGDVYQ